MLAEKQLNKAHKSDKQSEIKDNSVYVFDCQGKPINLQETKIGRDVRHHNFKYNL